MGREVWWTDTTAIKAEFVKALVAALKVYKYTPALHTAESKSGLQVKTSW